MNKIEITCADLRDGDILIDRSGSRWHVSDVEFIPPTHVGEVAFWLGDVRTKVRAHHMTKPADVACTVERIPTHADDVAELEAGSALAEPDPWQTPPTDSQRQDAAVAAVEQQLGGEVAVEQTAAEVDAIRRSTEDDPVVLPLFESMTDLEQRSHMFVLHGVFLEDVEDRAERIKVHAAAHRDTAAGKLKSRHTPHIHSSEKGAEK